MSGAILVAALAFAFHACASPALAPPAAKTAEVASTRAVPPTVEELKNATYAGLGERLGPVTLANGRWTGAPPASGAASRPSVELAGDFRVVGDLDGDGLEEAVVVLTYSSGGTGVLSFLAVVTREDGTLRNVATTALGDRVQVRSARVDGGRLLVSAVRAGENDAACCPGDLVEWQWTLGERRLNTPGAVRTGRLSLATLAGTVWILRAWDVNARAESEPVVTLSYDEGRFTGTERLQPVRRCRGGRGHGRRGEGGAAGGHAHGLPGPAVLGRGTIPRSARRCANVRLQVGPAGDLVHEGRWFSGHDAVRCEHSIQRAVIAARRTDLQKGSRVSVRGWGGPSPEGFPRPRSDRRHPAAREPSRVALGPIGAHARLR